MTTTVVTGSTGFLGSLIVDRILRETDHKLVLPIRSHHDKDEYQEHLVDLYGRDVEERLAILAITDGYDGAFTQMILNLGVTEVIHCAASVSYFDRDVLEASNVALTDTWLSIAKMCGVKRFTYISTAFSHGYSKDVIRETLPKEPDSDPTDYTATKRAAEIAVASSGLRYLVLRPSVVIGDSATGRYDGGPYGLYQFWRAGERYIDSKIPEFHLAMTNNICHFVHQDAFANAFTRAYTDNAEGFINIVSDAKQLPRVREVVVEWLKCFFPTNRIHFYDEKSSIPGSVIIDPRVELFFEAVSANLEIISYPFQFETKWLDEARKKGLAFTDVTRDSVVRCQMEFIKDSPRLTRMLIKR